MEVSGKCGGRAIEERWCGLRWDLRSEGSPCQSWEVEEISVGTRDGWARGPRERNMGVSKGGGGGTGLEEGAEMEGVPEIELGGRLRPWVLPPNPPAS